MSQYSNDPVAPHPTAGTYEVIASNFEKVVEGQLLVLEGNEETLTEGRFVDKPVPPPASHLPIDNLKEQVPGGRFVGLIDGNPCEVEVFLRDKRRVLVGLVTVDRPEVDIWVAEDDGGTLLPGDG